MICRFADLELDAAERTLKRSGEPLQLAMRAIRCAASVKGAAGLGLAARSGLHTGECGHIGGNYSGFAVDLARRIAKSEKHGETVLSRTVKDLVAGPGLAFNDIGVRAFDGIEGNWHLFQVVA